MAGGGGAGGVGLMGGAWPGGAWPGGCADDWGWGKADFKRAMCGIDLARPSVLLSHEPIALDIPATRGVSLILSGHTHGGQICLPVVGTPISHLWPKYFRYVRGMHESEGTRLYVSRGTG